MNFLKKLFGVGGSRSKGLYVYVQPKMCDQILRLEVDTKEQLSRNDTEDGYWVRKVANSPRCPFEAEVILYFDNNKNLIDREITDGKFVDEQAYQDFIASQTKVGATEATE